MRILTCILTVLILLSCHSHKKTKGIQIIPEDRFIKLLVEYHLTEGVQISQYFLNQSKKFAEISLCDTLLKNNRISKAVFDSTVSYYVGEPEKYDIIYEKVITELNKRKAQLELNTKIKEVKKDKKVK